MVTAGQEDKKHDGVKKTGRYVPDSNAGNTCRDVGGDKSCHAECGDLYAKSDPVVRSGDRTWDQIKQEHRVFVALFEIAISNQGDEQQTPHCNGETRT